MKNKLNTEKIDIIRSYFREIKPTLFKIEGHPLADKEEFVKELYISLLCSVSAYDNEIADSEKLYIERIIAICNLKQNFATYLKLGLDPKKETIDEFIKAFSKKDLGYSFIADALIIAAADGKLADKELELIAELSEILMLNKKDLEDITKLVSLIISQNEKGLTEYLNKNNLKSDFTYLIQNFLPYYVNPKTTKLYEGEVVFNNSTTILEENVIFRNAKVEIKKDVELIFNANKSIIIENTNFNLLNLSRITITNNNIIKIVNSEFKSAGSYPTLIENVESLEISKTTFTDFSNRTMKIVNTKNVNINNSVFSNCSYSESKDGPVYGGVFYINNSFVDVTKCTFNKCFVKNTYYYNRISSGFAFAFYNSVVLFESNIYNECKNISDSSITYDAWFKDGESDITEI